MKITVDVQLGANAGTDCVDIIVLECKNVVEIIVLECKNVDEAMKYLEKHTAHQQGPQRCCCIDSLGAEGFGSRPCAMA